MTNLPSLEADRAAYGGRPVPDSRAGLRGGDPAPDRPGPRRHSDTGTVLDRPAALASASASESMRLGGCSSCCQPVWVHNRPSPARAAVPVSSAVAASLSATQSTCHWLWLGDMIVEQVSVLRARLMLQVSGKPIAPSLVLKNQIYSSSHTTGKSWETKTRWRAATFHW